MYVGRHLRVPIGRGRHDSREAFENPLAAAHLGFGRGERAGDLPARLPARGARRKDAMGAEQPHEILSHHCRHHRDVMQGIHTFHSKENRAVSAGICRYLVIWDGAAYREVGARMNVCRWQ